MTIFSRLRASLVRLTRTVTIAKVAAAWFVGLCLCLLGYFVGVSVVLNAGAAPGLLARLGFYVAGAIMWIGILLIVVFTVAAVVRAVRALFAPGSSPVAHQGDSLK